MKTAKLFENGSSQAVRLPKDFQLTGKDVYVKKYGDIVLLIPKNSSWTSTFSSLEKFSDDFMQQRGDLPAQDREAF